MTKRVSALAILTTFMISFNNVQAISFYAETPSGHFLHYSTWDWNDTSSIVMVGFDDMSSHQNLTGNLIIPATVTNNGVTYSVAVIGSYAFCGCNSLTSVTFPSSINSIWDHAFANCTGLLSITLSSSITEIWDNAFYGCTDLSSITIPPLVRSIGASAFANCTGLTTIHFNAGYCVWLGNNNYYAFEGCNNVTTITIGDSVSYIPDYAFSGCTRVETITIGKNVESIYENSFENTLNSLTTINYNAINYSGSFYPFIGRSSITTVNIGDEVTVIPHLAFKDCTGLRTVTIGSAVDNIKNRAFYGCDHLISITCRAEYPPICQEETFTSVPRYADVIVPCGTAYRYQASNYWNEFTRIIEDCDDIDDVEDLPNIKINVIDGCIVVDGAESNTVWLYDVNGRILATKQDEYSPLHFDVPTSGTYLVQIGNHPARRVVVIR